MGWSRGSEVMDAVVLSLTKHAFKQPKVREDVYRDVIPVLLDLDADTLHDAKGHDPVYDRVIDELDPADE